MTCAGSRSTGHIHEDEKLLERLLSAGEYDFFDEDVILEGEFVEFDATRHATRQVIVGFTPMNFVVACRYIPSIRENLMLCPALFKVPQQEGTSETERKGAPTPNQEGASGSHADESTLSKLQEKGDNAKDQADGDAPLLKVSDENAMPMELADDFRETDPMLENLELSSVVHLKFMKIAFTEKEMNAYIGETKLRIYELCTTPLNGNIKEKWARWRGIAPVYIRTMKYKTSIADDSSSGSSLSIIDIINAEIRKAGPWREIGESDESFDSRQLSVAEKDGGPRAGTSQADNDKQENKTMPIVKLFKSVRRKLRHL